MNKLVLLVLVIILQLLTVLMAWYPADGKVTDRRRKGFSRFTTRGWRFIWAALVSFCIIVFQFLASDKIDKENELSLKREWDRRDSTNTANIIKNFADGMAKYGLRYDSLNKEIADIIVNDTSRKKTVIVLPEEPTIVFCPSDGGKILSKTSSTINIECSVCCFDASIVNGNAQISVITYDSAKNKLEYSTRLGTYMENATMVKDTRIVRSFTIRGNNTNAIQAIYLYGFGDYQNKLGKKYQFKMLVKIEMSKSKTMFGIPSSQDPNYKEVMKLIENKVN